MTIYRITEEDQIRMNQSLSDLFGIENNTPTEEYYCESMPWVDSDAQSRPGELNGMYGWKWGDNHPRGMLGKKHSEETKQKWSQTRKGRLHGM